MDKNINAKLISDRNHLIKENRRLRQALKIKGILWKDSKEYNCTNGKGEEITSLITTGEK